MKKAPYIGFFNERVLPKMAGKPILPIQPLKPHVLPNINPEHYETMQRNGKIISLLQRGLIIPEQFPRIPQTEEAASGAFITEQDMFTNSEILGRVDEPPQSPQVQSYGSIVPQFSAGVDSMVAEVVDRQQSPRQNAVKSPVQSDPAGSKQPITPTGNQAKSKLQIVQEEAAASIIASESIVQQPRGGAGSNAPQGEWVEYTGAELQQMGEPNLIDGVSIAIGDTRNENAGSRIAPVLTENDIPQLSQSPGMMNQSLAPLPSKQKTEYYSIVLNSILEQLETIPAPVGFVAKDYMQVMKQQRMKLGMMHWPDNRAQQVKQQLLVLGNLMRDELYFQKKQLSVLAEMESVFLHLPEDVRVEDIRKQIKIHVRVGLIAEGFVENTAENQKPALARIRALKGKLFHAKNITSYKNQILRITEAIQQIEVIEQGIVTGKTRDVNQAENQIEAIIERLHLKIQVEGILF